MGIDCLICKKEIQDGEEIADAQHGEAVIREGENEWTGSVRYGSVIKTVHSKCLRQMEGKLK